MPDGMRRGPHDWLVVAGPALIAALLCAYKLGDRSLWLDEGASVTIASQHGAALWDGIRHDGGNMLIYYLVLHVIISVFGDGEVAIRMMSLLANTGTAWLVGLLALRLFDDRRVALVAGLFSAISVSLVFWGQDARGYAAMVTATAASFYALVAILDSDPARRPPAVAVAGYGLATGIALYIGFDCILVVPAQILLALMLRRRLTTVIATLVVVGLLSVPLLVLAVQRGSGQLFWVPALSFQVLWQTLATLVSSGLPPNFHTTPITVIGAIAELAVVLVAIILAVRAVAGWRSRAAADARVGTGTPSMVLFPLAWLVVPAVIAVAASAAGEPIELARISILLMPALSLLVAWLLVGPSERLSAAPGWLARMKLPASAGTVVLVILLGLRLAALVPSYFETPEPWKEVAARVISAARPEDCLLFYSQDGHAPFGYYVTRTPGAEAKVPRSVLPAEAWNALKPHVEQYVLPTVAQLPALVRGCHRVFLVSGHQGQRHGPPQSRRNYAGYVAIRNELSQIYRDALVSNHGYASPITVTLYSQPDAT